MSLEKKHLRHCLLFTYHLKKNASEAQKIICTALGDNAVSYSTSKKWFQRFKNGNFDLNDEGRPGQPRKVEDTELEQLLEDNPFCSPSQLAEELGVTRQAISKRLHKLGKMRKRALKLSNEDTIKNKNINYDTATVIKQESEESH